MAAKRSLANGSMWPASAVHWADAVACYLVDSSHLDTVDNCKFSSDLSSVAARWVLLGRAKKSRSTSGARGDVVGVVSTVDMTCASYLRLAAAAQYEHGRKLMHLRALMQLIATACTHN